MKHLLFDCGTAKYSMSKRSRENIRNVKKKKSSVVRLQAVDSNAFRSEAVYQKNVQV